jgi:class 3 adenylate cyclase/tetratricopeptide (TPR) repeat protein
VPSTAERIALLQAAIAAQEALRPTMGDQVVETTLDALRQQLQALTATQDTERANNLEQMQRQLPAELAARAHSTPRREGEIKDVTVVFADLSDFTTLSEELGPEDIRAIQNELFSEVARVVYQYEGFVEKFVGDAVLAVFGAPVTHEDDAERALRAALAMRERVAQLSGRWLPRLGHTLQMHVGISSGRVVAGTLLGQGGDSSGAYAVTGDAVNTAARVLGKAGANQIVVSESTYELARHAFTFLSLGSELSKGKREPLGLFELQRARIRPERAHSVAGLGSTFVGRDRELRELCDLADNLCRGHGWSVLLVGEAGIGKSRLISEWRKESPGRIRWIEGHCYRLTSSVVFAPFIDALRREAGIREADNDAEARRKLALLVESAVPNNPDAELLFAFGLSLRLSEEESLRIEQMPTRARREQWFGLAAEAFAGPARQQPVILVIEDLHWADSASVELLQHLLPLTQQTQLAIAVVARAQDSALLDQFRQALGTLPAEQRREITLDALSEPDAALMAQQLLEAPNLQPQLRSLIREKAEGNPFFVEEMIRSLIAQGALVRADGGRRWAVTGLMASAAVPDGVNALLMANLDRLPDETKWVAMQASVVGRIVPDRILRALVGDSPTLDADIAQLEREGIFREVGGDSEAAYEFKHALTQEVAYRSLLARDRRELHLRVAQLIEALNADRLGGLQAVLGEHFFRGEAWERSAQCFLEAGNAAARLPAEVEARKNYARALEALERAPATERTREQRVDATLGLVSVSARVDASANLDRLRAIEPIAEALRPGGGEQGDLSRCARLYLWMGRSHYLLGDSQAALAEYQRVIKLAQELGDEELEAAASYSTGVLMAMRGNYGSAEPLLSMGIGPLERAASWSELIQALEYLGISQAGRGQYAAGLQTAGRGLERAQALKSVSATALCHMSLGIVHMYGGNCALMRDEFQTAGDLAQDSGDRVTYYIANLGLALAQSRMGLHASAREALERADATGVHAVPENHAAFASEVALNSGQFDLAITKAQEAIRLAQASSVISAEALAQRVWAEAIANQPNSWKEIESHFGDSVRLFESGECLVEAARTQVAWGLAGRLTGQPDADDHLHKAAQMMESSAFEAELKRVRALLNVS